MTRSRPASGGGRWVEVEPARLPRWLAGFQDRHGELTEQVADDCLVVTGADGEVARLHPPAGVAVPPDLTGFVAAVAATRRLGLLLARQGAAAIGVADGEQLLASKVDSWYVQGRTAAGGQSQQRFARRRTNQAAHAAGKAADIAVRLLVPPAGSLAALVTGGDRRTVDTILADPRLARLASLRADLHLPVPTPNLAVLRAAVAAARAVRVHLPAKEPPDASLGDVVRTEG